MGAVDYVQWISRGGGEGEMIKSDRKPVLMGEIETALKSEISTISDDLGIEVNAVECMPDHIHLLKRC